MHASTVRDYFGNRVRATQLAGLELVETTYVAGERVPAHAHAAPDLCLVLRGQFAETIGRRAFDCRAGVLLFRGARQVHADEFGTSGGRCFNVQFRGDWLSRLESLDGTASSQRWGAADGPSWLAHRLYRETTRPDAASALAVEGLALAILAEVGRRPTTAVAEPRRWHSWAEEFLRANFLRPITMRDVAAEAGVHRVHFVRSFRHHYGCTPAEFVRRLRIEWARSRLLESDLPVGEIAHAAGFYDHSHFAREFKRTAGCTPAQYRKAHRAFA
jgi:AraC family transcriptional regulator